MIGKVIEKMPYWKTSSTSPDTWLDRTQKVIEEFGGSVISRISGHIEGRTMFMLVFSLEGETYKIMFPVLDPVKASDRKAAEIQAATILYHDVKARLISSKILGAKNVFYGNLLLSNGKTPVEIEDPNEAIEISMGRSLGSGAIGKDVIDG